nr:Crp/Fnr family transcriptional regulator [Spirosomataceae bacterium]
MKDKIVKYFSNISPLSVEEAEAIKESSVIKTFKKGTILLREGQYSSDTYFVFEGLIRQYQIIDGEEKTTAFFTEDQWIISLNGSDSNKPSNC